MKTYDSTEVTLAIGATFVTDFETITVDKDEDSWTFSAGSAGESTRSYNANRLGTITVSLPQTNAVNAALSAYALSKAVLPIALYDKGGSSVAVMSEGTLVKMPTAEFAKVDSGTREWTFRGDLDVNVVGGN